MSNEKPSIPKSKNTALISLRVPLSIFSQYEQHANDDVNVRKLANKGLQWAAQQPGLLGALAEQGETTGS